MDFIALRGTPNDIDPVGNPAFGQTSLGQDHGLNFTC